MLKGWISIYRKLKDSWIWKLNEPFDKRSAWMDLLLNANYKPTQIEISGNLVDIDVGELVTSIDQLSKEWMWSRHKVSNFLNRLEMERYARTIEGQQKNSYKYYQLCDVPTIRKKLGHIWDTKWNIKNRKKGHQKGHQKKS